MNDKKYFPETLPYCTMDRRNALRLAADERFAQMVEKHNRKHSKGRVGTK